MIKGKEEAGICVIAVRESLEGEKHKPLVIAGINRKWVGPGAPGEKAREARSRRRLQQRWGYLSVYIDMPI